MALYEKTVEKTRQVRDKLAKIEEVLKQNRGKKTALYGLGTETERFLNEHREDISVVGLLDGFREEGEMYGCPIIPLKSAIEVGVSLIIVIARPGSCKAITRRIGHICREHQVALLDVRGCDLFAPKAAAYDFCDARGESKAKLMEKIGQAKVVSFDLFDTLIMRKIWDYTDLFVLLEKRLIGQGIYIPDFARLRLSAEKECSKDHAPDLVEIYDEVLRRAGGSFLSAEELAEMEWELDFSLMLPRNSVCEIFRETVSAGKRVVITTDSYYRPKQIRQILSRFHLENYEQLLVSCEKGTSKTQQLFHYLRDMGGNHGENVLHIGDSVAADIECAGKQKMETYRIYRGADLFDLLGGMGMETEIRSLSDRVKVGLFIAKMFNDPFVFEEDSRRLTVSDAADIGYLFCGPMITDFSIWLHNKVKQENFSQILFCARDGFLVGRLYRKVDRETKAFYFLASRIAAIRAGVENDADLAYVDSMKFSGTGTESLRVRFGIKASDIKNEETGNDVILNRSRRLCANYRKYIGKLGISEEETAMFDFVAKGTTQMYLQKLFPQHIKGFYFLQLEPEFMADRGLDIEPFYSDEEKDTSAIFDHYYILETILTSPYPQIEEFDENGNPVYSPETRSRKDIECFKRAQDGIVSYFEDYIRILPEAERTQNKRLDERFLVLVNRVNIRDREFMELKVEDPFFGRMTAITDVIG